MMVSDFTAMSRHWKEGMELENVPKDMDKSERGGDIWKRP